MDPFLLIAYPNSAITPAFRETDAVHVIGEVASGNMDKGKLAQWIGRNAAPFELDAA